MLQLLPPEAADLAAGAEPVLSGCTPSNTTEWVQCGWMGAGQGASDVLAEYAWSVGALKAQKGQTQQE